MCSLLTVLGSNHFLKPASDYREGEGGTSEADYCQSMNHYIN